MRFYDLCGRCGRPLGSPSVLVDRMCRDCCDVVGVAFRGQPVQVPDGHKRCTGCQEVKPHTSFYRNVGIGDGYRHRCKVCQSAAAATRYQRKKAGVA